MIEYDNCVEYSTVINGTKYVMIFEWLSNHWNVKFSSGFKRRELTIYKDKVTKSNNGYEVVKWALNTLNNFEYKGRITIHWADGRRRKIYGRFLIPLGFKLIRFENYMCYSKAF